jgi:hypothetical protein
LSETTGRFLGAPRENLPRQISEEIMSLIQYQQATYASQLRDQLELAGCETRVAAVVSRAVGDLIDHVARAQDDQKNEMSAAKRELFNRFIGITLFVMAAAIVSGVLIALFR